MIDICLVICMFSFYKCIWLKLYLTKYIRHKHYSNMCYVYFVDKDMESQLSHQFHINNPSVELEVFLFIRVSYTDIIVYSKQMEYDTYLKSFLKYIFTIVHKYLKNKYIRKSIWFAELLIIIVLQTIYWKTKVINIFDLHSNLY